MASVWSEHPGPFLSTSHTKVENEREWIPGFLSRTRRGLIGTEITGQIRDTNHGSAQNCRLWYSDFYRRVVSILSRLPFQIRSSSREDDRRGIWKQCGENYENGIFLKILDMIILGGLVVSTASTSFPLLIFQNSCNSNSQLCVMVIATS